MFVVSYIDRNIILTFSQCVISTVFPDFQFISSNLLLDLSRLVVDVSPSKQREGHNEKWQPRKTVTDLFPKLLNRWAVLGGVN